MATGRLMTLIQTAKLNGLDAERYLSWAMSNASSLPPSDLVPWSGKVPKSVLAGPGGATEAPVGPTEEP